MNLAKTSCDFLTSFKRVLVLCPHTDDEFGCAGTIFRITDSKIDIRYLALSRCEASVPQGFPSDILETECRECASLLGIKPNQVDVWNFSVRNFPEVRQDILENLIKLKKEYNPDLVLMPSSMDTHQDHATVFKEGFRAFKNASILGYELPQNLVTFKNTAFVKMTEEYLEKKVVALSAYKSQAFRNYASHEFIYGLAKVRGVQCNAQYAEAFELVRLII